MCNQSMIFVILVLSLSFLIDQAYVQDQFRKKSITYTSDQIAEIVNGISQDVLSVIIENTKMEVQNTTKVQNIGDSDSLADAFKQLADVLKQQKSTTQITKLRYRQFGL